MFPSEPLLGTRPFANRALDVRQVLFERSVGEDTFFSATLCIFHDVFGSEPLRGTRIFTD